MTFEKQCPKCKQMWSNFNGKVCPDCESNPLPSPRLPKQKTTEWDAIEPPIKEQRVDVYG